jgi:hypothetical protein
LFSVLEAHKVVQVRLIFSPITSVTSVKPPIYFYREAFKFSSLYRTDVDGVDMFAPAPHVDMFVLNCHLRSNGSQMGDIFQLTDIREVVELVPQFGSKVDNQLNCNNLLDIPDTFYLNNFTGKDNFHAILSYQ